VAFDEFVEKQTEETKRTRVDVEKETQEWAKKIEELHETVKNHLREYTENNKIEIESHNVTLHESLLGAYEAKALTIKIGKKMVGLEPKGRFVIGAFGRVDMIGPAGTVKIVLVDGNLNSPHISVTITNGGRKANASPNLLLSGEKNWKLSTPPPRIEYYDLDKENFLDALMQVANG
jgi:hypothetical protein